MDKTILTTPLPDRTILVPKRTNFKYEEKHVKFIIAEGGSRDSTNRRKGKFWVNLAEKFNLTFNVTVSGKHLEHKWRRLTDLNDPPVPGGSLVDRRKGRTVKSTKRKNPRIIEEVQKSLDNEPSISLTQRTKNLSSVLSEPVCLLLGLS